MFRSLILKIKPIAVKVKAGKDNIEGNLQLELPGNWSVSPIHSLHFRKKGMEQVYYLSNSSHAAR
jgi:hypothetical protein